MIRFTRIKGNCVVGSLVAAGPLDRLTPPAEAGGRGGVGDISLPSSKSRSIRTQTDPLRGESVLHVNYPSRGGIDVYSLWLGLRV